MAAQRDKDKKKNTENPQKKAKKDPAVPAVARDDDDDDDKEDLEELLEKGKHKRATKSLYRELPTTEGHTTTSQDRTGRMLATRAKEEKDLEEAQKNAPEPDPDDDDDKEER